MIRVVTQGLEQLAVQAVVRAADAALAPVGPVSLTLDRCGGERLASALQTQAPLEIGSAVVTAAGDLAAEFLLHLIVQDGDRPASSTSLRRALTSAWHRAEAWQLRTVAADPCGLLLVPEEAAQLVIETFREQSERGFPSDLYLAVSDPEFRERLTATVGNGRP
jgi:O-acetyl-ADP-ribose deacetylase (regulator of RNase III)